MTAPATQQQSSAGAPQQNAFVHAERIHKRFPVHGGILNRVVANVHAVTDVSFSIARGETLGVVGESGCGKSTLGKMVIRLLEPTEGRVYLAGSEITGLDHKQMMSVRRRMQIIFQDPYSSLNPRLTVRGLLKEAISFHNIVTPDKMESYIDELIATVGMRPESKDKFPHEFSGGQRQRLGIARALALKPEFIVADEPVSALDVSIQAQVLNLMKDLKEQLGLTMMFISHDLKVVEHFCDNVMVMYLGRVMEKIQSDRLREHAEHPYTRALLGSNPIDDPDERRPLTVLQGDVPSPLNPPPGCPFAGRCPEVQDRCRTEMPPLEMRVNGQAVACWARM
ncbi:MAG: ATP-binding cassette domain-containing protein [Phycisphaera sp.]|nr:MAG: ATP-binding cassette domain-containing protein [Phycisphaera sp.]